MKRPIDVTQTVRASFEHARGLLVHDPVSVLESPDTAGPNRRTFTSDLSARLGRGELIEEVEIEVLARV